MNNKKLGKEIKREYKSGLINSLEDAIIRSPNLVMLTEIEMLYNNLININYRRILLNPLNSIEFFDYSSTKFPRWL